MNLLYKEMNGAFEEETGISYTKLEILYQISQTANMCQQDIQQKLGVDAASITRHLKKLEEEKLITRIKDQENKRFLRIALTQDGQTQLKKLIAEKNQYEEKIFANLSLEQIDALEDMVHQVSRNITNKN
ncbi:MarR family transcriptional regulator [Carnobacterium maltaromaticum]|uniref:MarR family transcriptional regulator n=2 Tax=Carnobacterium maltaromaticum TaxID=2751 RepID=A0AAW9JZ20_CARML|nr:MarR family transcriptional regulator [Carnobacterium maltaromaticum]